MSRPDDYRMEILGLDSEEVARSEPLKFRQMLTRCDECEHKRRCVQDIASRPELSAWHFYCPNYDVLHGLPAWTHATWWATLIEASRRRMVYLMAGATAPALGSFPFLLFGSNIFGWGQYYQRDKKKLDVEEVISALRDCGYDVLETRPAGAPFGAVLGGVLGRVLGRISGLLAGIWPSMFAFQTVVVCRPRPGVRQLITRSERHGVVSSAFRGVLSGATSQQSSGGPLS